MIFGSGCANPSNKVAFNSSFENDFDVNILTRNIHVYQPEDILNILSRLSKSRRLLSPLYNRITGEIQDRLLSCR